jgi:hypothetical protein
MKWADVLRERRKMHREEGRNVRELKFYTTDDLRRLYQETKGDVIKLHDGIVTRVQLVAEIRWRVLWTRCGYGLVLVGAVAAVIGAVAAVIAAAEGWK